MNTEHPGLAKLLDAQFGVLSAAQAARLGLHSMVLRRWVESHGWRRPLPRIYVHPDANGFETEAKALCLWGGDRAVLSHAAAARLLGLAGMQSAPAEVTLESARSCPAATVHRGTVPPEDRRTLRGIPHTSAARTLIDLAAVASEEALAIAFDDAWQKRLVQIDWVERRLFEMGARGRPGADALGRVLSDARRRGKPLDSPLEVQFWRFARRFFTQRLPTPGFEVWSPEGAQMVIDFAYPAERLAIEAHSFLFHGQKSAHERDALRSSRLAAIGWRIIFVTAEQLRHPERLARRIRAALAFDLSVKPPRYVVHDAFEVPG
jgi:very-short-patch-repair endonuclease